MIVDNNIFQLIMAKMAELWSFLLFSILDLDSVSDEDQSKLPHPNFMP